MWHGNDVHLQRGLLDPVLRRWLTAGMNSFLNQDKKVHSSIQPDSETPYMAPARPWANHSFFGYTPLYTVNGGNAHIQKLIHKPGQWCRTYFEPPVVSWTLLAPRVAKTLSEATARQKPVSSQFHMRCAYVGEVRPRFTNPIFLKKVVTASNHPEMVCLFVAKALFTERCWFLLR